MEKKSILLDKVTKENFVKYNYASSCEDCTHFDFQPETCTLGYPTSPHLKRNQWAQILKTGEMAFCRTIETD